MEDIQNTRNQISKTTKALDEALMKRKDTVNMHIDECLNTIQEERNRVINKLTEQKLLLESLSAALQNLKKYDPDRLLELKQQELVAIDSVNRWTGKLYIYSFTLIKVISQRKRKINRYATPDINVFV